ncbi:hypothetical protein [Pedobacter sp. L105]|uniref:hypothetical protein n=1 Tax=Pedobacter sp. L105 TaxID=1641871 RepID=UPI00131BA8AA|nr:hypothetical protein [Pedobacter sp. L105]
MKTIYYCLLFLLISSSAFAQNANINNFLVKEGLLKNSKLAIIAADSLGEPMENINGVYTFTISGFTQHIKFNDGVGNLPMQLDKSSFVYVKHENDKGTHSKLLYVYKKDGTLNPYTINSMWLVLFPLILIFLAFAFRRLIIIIVIILLVYVYFNHSNGLNLSTFFETIFDNLKKAF